MYPVCVCVSLCVSCLHLLSFVTYRWARSMCVCLQSSIVYVYVFVMSYSNCIIILSLFSGSSLRMIYEPLQQDEIVALLMVTDESPYSLLHSDI